MLAVLGPLVARWLPKGSGISSTRLLSLQNNIKRSSICLYSTSRIPVSSDKKLTQTDGHTEDNTIKHNQNIERKMINNLSFNVKYADYVKGDTKPDDGMGYGLVALFIAMFGISFACVPLYEYFCQQSGYLGTTKKTKTYTPPPENLNLRKFEIDFVTHSNLNWEFKPCQKRVVVRPGETTLSFYTAKNLSKEPVIGVAAYHVIPDEAGLYFNKIQCFCFEEQLLNPGEEVDLPVLFFLDPEIVKDKKLHGVDKITLSYIFFEANSEIPPEYKSLFNQNSEPVKNN
uniref:Cytochrome c oxidase assembly protein-like, putative n=1 Tax=Theileria annulata TaxID=5874 RepID=A0A3B0N5T9_THEAN